MSESLDFSGAEIEVGNQYLAPGVHVVKITEVKAGNSSQKGTPYVEFTVADKSGQVASQQYYLTTTVKEGSTKSAFDISKNAILQLIMSSMNVDETTAKTKLVGLTTDNIATKLATLLVGKTLAIRLNGQWVNPTDTSKKSWVKAIFGTGKFTATVDQQTTLSYDPTKHIKGTPVTSEVAATTSPVKADW